MYSLYKFVETIKIPIPVFKIKAYKNLMLSYITENKFNKLNVRPYSRII